VTIVFAKPIHGVVPRVVGLKLPEARKQLARLKLVPVIRGSGDVVYRQNPHGAIAAAPGLKVTLWVRRGSQKKSPGARTATAAR
jgi:beta-lactam-binding protein with PASTA domain